MARMVFKSEYLENLSVEEEFQLWLHKLSLWPYCVLVLTTDNIEYAFI